MSLEKKFTSFFQLTKVDEVKKEVHGIITSEEVDGANEILDYEGSKPYFEAWNKEFSDVTNGASVGNLRSMHTNIAAGKFISMEYDDVNKVITAIAKVVDANEWEKVVEGVYTGFSIGGKYVKRWYDSALKAYRYIAQPVEASLVDKPCCSSAKFSLIKADGSEIEKNFVNTVEMETSEMKINVNQSILEQFRKAMTGNNFEKVLSFEEIKSCLRAGIRKQINNPFDMGYFWIMKTYDTYCVITLENSYDNPLEEYYKVDYSIVDDLVAINAIQKVNISFTAVEDNSIGKTEEPAKEPKEEDTAKKTDNPDVEKTDSTKTTVEETVNKTETPEESETGLFVKATHVHNGKQEVSFSNETTELNKSDLLRIDNSELYFNKQDSSVYKTYKPAINQFEEELNVIKAGNRNNKTDKDAIQKMHDLAVKLGAECTKPEAAKTESDELSKIENSELQKAVKRADDLEKTVIELQEEVKKLGNQPDDRNSPILNAKAVEKTLAGSDNEEIDPLTKTVDMVKRAKEIAEEPNVAKKVSARTEFAKDFMGMAYTNPVKLNI